MAASERSRPGDAAERAYQEIRRSIGVGDYGPGTRLTEAQLGETLAMSRTPIRAALVRLDAEGFVTLTPKRGAVVAAETTIDFEEFLAIREALEVQAAGVAATAIDETGIAALRTNLELTEKEFAAAAAGAAAAALNREFHVVIARLSGRPRLESLVAGLYELPLLHEAAQALGDEERLRISVVQHREIVVALERSDSEWAEAAMGAHLRSARRIFTPAPAGSLPR